MGADACVGADGAPKNEALIGDTKVLQSSPESTRPLSRRLTVFNDVLIVLIYILYIFSVIFYFFTLVCPYMTNRKAEPAHRRSVALVQYGRERRAVGGSAHRSAHHDKRADRSARMARVQHLPH